MKMQKREVATGGLIIKLSASGACFNQLYRMKIILIQFAFSDMTKMHLIEFLNDSDNLYIFTKQLRFYGNDQK